LRIFVAGNKATPASALMDLAQDGSSNVRQAAAGNPKLPKNLLKQLLQDKDEDVRLAAHDAS
jgi:hypothetical protein